MEVALYWDSTEMPPLSTVKKVNGKPDADLQLKLQIAAGNNTARHDWENSVLPRLEVMNDGDDLVSYRYKRQGTSIDDAVFAPKHQTEDLVYITCPRNSLGDLMMCFARTDLNENLVLKYNISPNDLNRWREIDARARTLASSFRVAESSN
jgi:hypothetical protein